MMTKLHDLEAVLLSAATQRSNDSLLPAPDAVAGAGTRLTKAISELVNRGLAEQRETRDRTAVYREDGDLHFGAFITKAGNAAIGVDDATIDAAHLSPPSSQPLTKMAVVLALLQREKGATLSELVTATGWLPHTTRAALTGLRKKGHAIDRSKRDNDSCYRMATTA